MSGNDRNAPPPVVREPVKEEAVMPAVAAEPGRPEGAQTPADAELVNQVCRGDEAAFELLFHRHKRRVGLIASRFFRRRDQIEEIIQESFTKAYFALDGFSGERESSFSSWLSRIAFNTCYDEMRRLQRSAENAASDLSDEQLESLRDVARGGARVGDVESATISRDLADKLLARLKPEDRLVLILLDVEELSVAEIAGVMNWSVSKVKVRAHRARARLRRVLNKFV